MLFWVFIQKKWNFKISKKNLYPHVHGNIIFNTQDMKAT